MRPTFPRLRQALLMAAMLAPLHNAWALYKVVGPNGEITFTDVPPITPGRKAETINPAGTGPARADLPYVLKRVVQARPVLLYTTPHCPACEEGAKLLRARGVPYTEKTVSTPADLTAFHANNPHVDNLPLLSIGGVKMTPGFDSVAWNQALSAAGYPENSMLPATYRFAAPEHLAPAASSPPRETPAPRQPVVTPPPARPPSNSNAPPGFQF